MSFDGLLRPTTARLDALLLDAGEFRKQDCVYIGIFHGLDEARSDLPFQFAGLFVVVHQTSDKPLRHVKGLPDEDIEPIVMKVFFRKERTIVGSPTA